LERTGPRTRGRADRHDDSRRSTVLGSGSRQRLLRIVGNQHGLPDRDDLVRGHPHPPRVLSKRLLVNGLIDKEGPQASIRLRHYIAADPAHLIGHLVVADPARQLGGLRQLLRRSPCTASANSEGVHSSLLSIGGRARPSARKLVIPRAGRAQRGHRMGLDPHRLEDYAPNVSTVFRATPPLVADLYRCVPKVAVVLRSDPPPRIVSPARPMRGCRPDAERYRNTTAQKQDGDPPKLARYLRRLVFSVSKPIKPDHRGGPK
jgi:hypothetical protein